MKVAIVYRGNIRGFKYEECFRTHKKLYDDLFDNNIEFDTYLCSNNVEYDDINVNRIINLKGKYILDIDDIHKKDVYHKVYQNIKFKTQGWSSKYQNNIITYWYNNNYLFDRITINYDKYLLIDIAHIIDKFDIKLLYDDQNYVSTFESNNGYNTRLMIADYSLYKTIMTQFDYINNNNNNLEYHNPEEFNKFLLNKHNIIKTDKIKIFRIRFDRTILKF